MSRTTFTERFRTVAGVPPLTYLNRWRMLLAQQALRDRDVPVRSVAAELGYRHGSVAWVLTKLAGRIWCCFDEHSTVGVLGAAGVEAGLARLCLLLAQVESGLLPEPGAAGGSPIAAPARWRVLSRHSAVRCPRCPHNVSPVAVSTNSLPMIPGSTTTASPHTSFTFPLLGGQLHDLLRAVELPTSARQGGRSGARAVAYPLTSLSRPSVA
jgi:hypothetical protein